MSETLFIIAVAAGVIYGILGGLVCYVGWRRP